MSAPDRLTTFEIGSIYGVAPQSLRFYEDQGLLCPLIKDGARFYSARDRVKLELIIKGKRLGFSFLELKLLIVNTIEERACRAIPTQDSEPVRRTLEKQDIAEEIWQAERKIEELQGRIIDLKGSLCDDCT